MKYAVFIISHNRADRVETWNTLREARYSGKLYVMIDNEDKSKVKYVNRFGIDTIVFDKSVAVEDVDTLETSDSKSSPVFARNVVETTALELGLDAYIIMDDDIKNLRYRWVEDNKVRSLSITQNLDKVFDLYLDFMVKSDMSATSFANVMLYIGGVNGIDSRISNNREMYQIHMRNMKYPVEWKSLVNNDTITELLCARQGYFLWSLPFVIQDSPKMNTLPGGMKKVYDSISDFKRAFFATVALPSVCTPVVVKNKWVIGRNKKAAYPKVISSRYKK